MKKPARFCTRPRLRLALALALSFAIDFPIAAGASPLLPPLSPLASPLLSSPLPAPPRSRRPNRPPPPPRPSRPSAPPSPSLSTAASTKPSGSPPPPRPASPRTTPNDGSPATEPTDVWVAYDDHALYVAAFCRDSEPAKIRKRLGRRDTQTDSDWFMVAVDPYFDKRSGYAFVRQPGRLHHRHGALERHRRGRLLGRRLGDQGRRQRRGLDGRDAHPLQPDPLPEEGRVRLGRQLQAHGPAQERAVELQLGAEERVGRACRGSPASRACAASARAGASSSCPMRSRRRSSGPRRRAIPSRPGIAPPATPASTSRSA
ncbi:MAG: hypothetical protein MZU84_08115 [Sphingobacterium sp.]|nr:hypothetical protein [Sphingobacterium sp.]